MDRRSKHVGKSERDRGVYVGRLARASYSSTAEVEGQLPLTESDVSEEEPSFVPPGTRRPRSFVELVKEHFGHNWIYYVMTLVIGLVIAFVAVVYDFSGSLGRIEGTLDGIKNNLDAQENKIEDIEDKIHDQELKLQEQGIKMDYLEKELEETQ